MPSLPNFPSSGAIVPYVFLECIEKCHFSFFHETDVIWIRSPHSSPHLLKPSLLTKPSGIIIPHNLYFVDLVYILFHPCHQRKFLSQEWVVNKEKDPWFYISKPVWRKSTPTTKNYFIHLNYSFYFGSS